MKEIERLLEEFSEMEVSLPSKTKDDHLDNNHFLPTDTPFYVVSFSPFSVRALDGRPSRSFLEAVRSIPGAKWDSRSKTWNVPLVFLSRMAKTYALVWSEEARAQREQFRAFWRSLDSWKASVSPEQFEEEFSYPFKTPPFSHQFAGIRFLVLSKRGILGDEMGTGKTKTVIDAAVILSRRNEVSRALIICPNSVVLSWGREIEKHSFAPYVLLLGSKRKRKKRLEEDALFYVINYEGVRSLLDDLLEKGFDLVVLDECHRIKSHSAQVTKAVFRFSSVEYKFALSGTPTGDKPLDVWSIVTWLYPYLLPDYYSFRDWYCVTVRRSAGTHFYTHVVGYRHLGELQKVMNKIMLRRKKRDVLDLPDKIYERRDVFLEGEQLEVYNAVKEELLDELSKIKDWSLSNPLAKMIRLAQITAHLGFYDETSNVSAKIDALQEVLEELEGQMDRGVVVWSRFNFCVQAITKALEKRYRVRGFFGEDSVTGNRMSLEERQEVLDSFKRGDLDVVVVNPKAGGEGVEFTPADAEIFFDRTFSRLEMQQAEDRCHRPGMADRLLIIDLVAYKTIDELTYDLLRTKIAIASALLGELETVRALGKEKVLRYF